MTRDERIERLLQQEIDGANTEAEAAELARLLAEDPDLRAELDRLRSMADILAKAEQTGPPTPLWPAVEAEIAAEPSTRRTPARRVAWRRWRPQLAWGFAAGLAAGLAVMVVLTDSLNHPTSLEWSLRPYGAIGVDPYEGGELAGSPWRQSLEGAELTVSATSVDEVVSVEISVTTVEDWSLRIEAVDGLRCRGWTNVRGESGQVASEGTVWSITTRGPAHLRTWFVAPGDPGRLRIHWQVAGEPVADGEIGTAPAGP